MVENNDNYGKIFIRIQAKINRRKNSIPADSAEKILCKNDSPNEFDIAFHNTDMQCLHKMNDIKNWKKNYKTQKSH